MKGIPTCSKVQDHRWRDYRWLTMELDKFAKEHPVDISLRDLSQVLQKLGLDDKIALFSEYVQHNDSGTIDISDVLQQLLWNSDNRKEIGYWRGYHQTKKHITRPPGGSIFEELKASQGCKIEELEECRKEAILKDKEDGRLTEADWLVLTANL